MFLCHPAWGCESYAMNSDVWYQLEEKFPQVSKLVSNFQRLPMSQSQPSHWCHTRKANTYLLITSPYLKASISLC